MTKSRNIITKKDCIKAHSFDKNGKRMATIYDSGFTCISSVISQLNQKGGGWLHPIYEISIYNIDRDWSARYNKICTVIMCQSQLDVKIMKMLVK